jgi:GMP synthase (glutamine-hydrolysing)
MRITVLRNDPEVPPGSLLRVAADHEIEVDVVALDAGDALSSLSRVDAVVVLGGEMGAYDTVQYPYLADEKAFLRSAVDRGIPVLGLCLGCQLLAEALGGSAYLATVPEVAFASIEGIAPDPVVDILTTEPSLMMHRDTWDLPPGGVLLARSARYRQAFRLGSALGIQPHPEVDADIVASWFAHESSVELALQAGADPTAVLAAVTSNMATVDAVADRFFGAWIAEAKGRVRGLVADTGKLSAE